MSEAIMRLTLSDAATNCHRDGALAKLTLRSGVEFEGKLKQPSSGGVTAHMKIGDGWATILIEEIAAVSTRRIQ